MPLKLILPALQTPFWSVPEVTWNGWKLNNFRFLLRRTLEKNVLSRRIDAFRGRRSIKRPQQAWFQRVMQRNSAVNITSHQVLRIRAHTDNELLEGLCNLNYCKRDRFHWNFTPRNDVTHTSLTTKLRNDQLMRRPLNLISASSALLQLSSVKQAFRFSARNNFTETVSG